MYTQISIYQRFSQTNRNGNCMKKKSEKLSVKLAIRKNLKTEKRAVDTDFLKQMCIFVICMIVCCMLYIARVQGIHPKAAANIKISQILKI